MLIFFQKNDLKNKDKALKNIELNKLKYTLRKGLTLQDTR